MDQASRQILSAARLVDEPESPRLAQPWLEDYLAGCVADAPDGCAPRGLWGPRYIIGLTGNIATGKSTVLKALGTFGAHIIDADKLVHQLREPGRAGYTAIVDLLGASILQADGRLDTQSLSKRAFAEPDLLVKLEQIFRPLVVAEVERMGRASTARVIVVEAIKLLEGGLRHQVDSVWVVDAAPEVRIQRLVADRGLSADQARMRVETQPPQAEKLVQADVIIRNDGSLADTHWQIWAAWSEVLACLFSQGWLDDALVDAFISQALAYAGEDMPTAQARALLASLA